MSQTFSQLRRQHLRLIFTKTNAFQTRPWLYYHSVRQYSKCSRSQQHDKDNGEKKKKCHAPAALPSQQSTALQFWSSRSTWGRASVNTLRCLVGCTLGDFSAMWFLQLHCADIGMGAIMGISMASGLSASMLLETVLLRLGKDKLPWTTAARTAAGMSLISMITMELAENAVDYYLTGGTVAMDSPGFWAAALVSMAAGFVAPLPYNYMRLRKYGKACH